MSLDSRNRAVASARRKVDSARSSLSNARKEVIKAEEALQKAKTESQRKSKHSALSRAREKQRRKENDLASAEKALSNSQAALQDEQNMHDKKQQRLNNEALKRLSGSQKRLENERIDFVRDRLASVSHDTPLSGGGDGGEADTYDLFISHASEDKDDFVRPFAEKLQAAGLSVWYDELTLTIGDNLRRSIDRGLAASKFGVVVLSPSFFAKEWPQYELDGLVQRQATNGQKVILPIWHKVTRDEVISYSPSLAGLIAMTTATSTVDEIVEQIVGAVRQS